MNNIQNTVALAATQNMDLFMHVSYNMARTNVYASLVRADGLNVFCTGEPAASFEDAICNLNTACADISQASINVWIASASVPATNVLFFVK